LGIVKTLGQELEERLKIYSLIIDVEGHTDDVPINTFKFPSNWELSSSRSASVVKEFTDLGLDTKIVRAIGHADSFPLKPNRDDSGVAIASNMAMNRRVDVIVHY
jgi:chemotaxis protein MotB